MTDTVTLNLSIYDVLGQVADQLPIEHRAKLVAGLAVSRMLQELSSHTLGTVLLDSPFNSSPFTVRTAYIERDGRPFLTSTLFEGVPSDPDPKIVAVIQLGRFIKVDEEVYGGDADIHPIFDPAFREKLSEFGKVVFDTLKEAAESPDEETPEAVAA